MLPNPINANPQMEQLANNAVTFARDKFRINLDYSENSLQKLENLLQHAHEGYKQGKSNGNWSNAAIEKTVRVWGSYFGEVIRLQMGGNWIEDQNNVFLQLNSRRLDPLGQVLSRIVDGPLYNVQSFFQGLKFGIQDNYKEKSNAFISDKYMSPISSNDKGPKNRAAIYIVGIIGALVVVGLCIMGVWILLSQGIISLPLINKPLISSTPLFSPTPIYSSTPTPSPIPLPTATQALFSKPVSYLIPRVSDLPNTFDIDTENQAVQLIKKSMNLPSEYQDIIAFKDNSSSTKPLYGPHDGTPLTATIWITIFPTIGGGEEYMRKINTSDSINSMMNVINPTALLDVNPSPALKITSPETACDEINVYKSYELVLTDAVSVSANCRIINVVIIFWSLTNDNYDGQGAHIPDSLLNQQTVSFLSLVMEKIK